MSILVDENTKLVVQGVTGREGQFRRFCKVERVRPGQHRAAAGRCLDQVLAAQG